MSDEATAPAETPPAPWYTEEIEEALTKALHPGLYETDGLLHPALALSGQWQARHKVRAALDAIAPMVLDLLDEEYAKGYSDAYWNEDDKGVTE